MKVLIGYFSETGNTKRIAEAMGDASTASGHDVDVKAIGEITPDQLNEYSVVVLGSTCHSSDVAAPVRNLLDSISEGATFKLAGFVTHATTMPEGEDWKKEMYTKWAGKCSVTFETLSKEGSRLSRLFPLPGSPESPH